MRTIKLSQFAKEHCIKYGTAWRWFKEGKLPTARQLVASGTIIIDVEDDDNNKIEETSTSKSKLPPRVVLYARTSSTQNKKMLDEQLKRLETYAASRGYTIIRSVKEFGSGLNDTRKGLGLILKKIDECDKIIVEHRDRLTRFGFNWFQLFTNNKIEVMNETKTSEEEITQDLISIIHSFAAKIYGLRKKQRKIVELIKE